MTWKGDPSLRGDLVFNVEDYRASTDGSDNACVQAALAAAQTADGGIVYFPKKLYTVSQTIVVRRNFHLQGGGTWTVVKLANGSNVDLIQTFDFATLTGGITQTGPDNFSFTDITFDGNGTNQTGTSWTYRGYGGTHKVSRVFFKNGRSGNVWSEWGQGGTNMEAQWSDFKVFNSIAGDNMVWNGPHDSTFSNGFVFRDGTVTDNIGDGIKTQGNAGGEMFANVHVWGGHANGWMLNKLAIATNCTSEGAYAINVLINAIRSVFTGTVYGRSSGTGAAEVGVQIGTSGGSAITGYIVAVTAWQWNATTSLPFNFVNDGGGAALSTVYKTTATAIRGGTVSTKSAVTLNCADVPDLSFTYSPRIILNWPGGSVLQITNGVKDMMRFVSSGTDGLMQLPSNTAIRGYSDAYTTETWRISSSTGTMTTNGDIECLVATKGVILKSPDGTRYRVTVANGGALVTTAL